jgi:hypothetical protein
VVTDVDWIADAVKAFRVFLPAQTRLFHNDEFQLAKDWLEAGAS